MERTSGEEYLVKCEIEDHPVVNSVGFLSSSGKNKTDVYANLRCYGDSLDGNCSVEPVGIRMSNKRPTQLDCLCDLHTRIQQNHATSAFLQRKHCKLSHQQSNQGHSRHHARQGPHDDRKNHVVHSSVSAVVTHVLKEGVTHRTREYTD